MHVDVRDEGRITAFMQHIRAELGPIDYILHGVAFGIQQVMCLQRLPGGDAPAPGYIEHSFRRFYGFLQH